MIKKITKVMMMTIIMLMVIMMINMKIIRSLEEKNHKFDCLSTQEKVDIHNAAIAKYMHTYVHTHP